MYVPMVVAVIVIINTTSCAPRIALVSLLFRLTATWTVVSRSQYEVPCRHVQTINLHPWNSQVNNLKLCMGESSTLHSLRGQDDGEQPEARDLRSKALLIVEGLEHGGLLTSVTDALSDLLNIIIKPLFYRSQHERLTSTGRKKLIHADLPATATRFSQNLFFGENKPLWKSTWTCALLSYIIEHHNAIDDLTQRKKTIEENFYLLVPPILQMIDDVDILYKTHGCRHLYQLSQVLVATQSTILKRSGLTDVFVEALKNDFSYLPSLTPEEDSIMLYEQLYPAYLGLVQARFPSVDAVPGENSNSQRQSYLTLLLRHQLLHALAHLATGSGSGSTTSPKLSTLLLTQLSNVVREMDTSASLHLSSLVPLLSNVMSDPFSVAAPHMLLAAAKALDTLTEVCRLSLSAWWTDILKPTITCWLVVRDDQNELSDETTPQTVSEVQSQLRKIVQHLRTQIGQEFENAERSIVQEDGSLDSLFSEQ